MKRKIYALIVTAALFLSVNGLVMAEGKDLRVGTIQFSHLNQLPEDFLMEKLPVKSGETYSNKSLSDIYLALKRLSYISNVNVYPKVEGDTVNLVIEVDEAGNALELAQREESAQDLGKKTEFKVSSVDISGIKTLNKEDFLKDIPVKVGEYFTPQDAINGAAKIFQSGYFSSVDPKVDRKTDNTISILYVVEENPAVQNVTIKGNTLFTQDELVKALGLKQGEVLNGNLLDPDRNGIIRHYSQAG